MRRGVWVAFGGCLVALAACGGGDGEAEPTDSAAPTTSVMVTTPETSTTTTTTSTTTTTTLPPATTLDPTESLIADIEADLNEGEQAFVRGAMTPADPAARAALETYFAGSALDFIHQTYDALVEEGLIARPNKETPSKILVTALVEQSDDRAVVEYCRIDSAVVVEPLADGREIVVNDNVTRYTARLELHLVDGVWMSSGGGDILSETAGGTCA